MVAGFCQTFFFFLQKTKKKFSYKKCFPNLIFCVYLFVWLSVCQCHCKYPSFRHQTKFRLKVLAPVLASDDTILEIFHSNDLIFFPFLLLKWLSLGQKLHKKKFFFLPFSVRKCPWPYVTLLLFVCRIFFFMKLFLDAKNNLS